MRPYYQDKHCTIYHGDMREVLPGLDGFTACVTDPPYGLEFMGKDWDKGVPGEEFWRIIAAACLPGAPLLSFGGTRTYHRLACAIEDAGWEIRDCLMWLYGSGFPKSLDVGKAIDKAAGAEREVVGRKPDPRYDSPRNRPVFAHREASVATIGSAGMGDAGDITTPATDAAKLWDGWGTALKPAYEPILLAMNPLDGTFAQNAQRHGVAGLNVDGGRIGTADGGHRDGGRRPPVNEGYQRPGGSMFEDKTEWQMPTKGRWPANVIHDGSAEVVEGFPSPHGAGHARSGMRDTSGDAKGMFPAHGKGGHRMGDEGSAARFFYCAKSSRAERGRGNNHPTVKPLALMKYLLTLVTMPERNLIIDPFMGSGSTLVTAGVLRLPCVGIDLEEANCEIAANRLGKPIVIEYDDEPDPTALEKGTFGF